MSIVIDDDDYDIICTTDQSSTQERSFIDDRLLSDYIQKDLDGRFTDVVSEAYHTIFQSYVEKVDTQMNEKIDIEAKIKSAQSEREALLKSGWIFLTQL